MKAQFSGFGSQSKDAKHQNAKNKKGKKGSGTSQKAAVTRK